MAQTKGMSINTRQWNFMLQDSMIRIWKKIQDTCEWRYFSLRKCSIRSLTYQVTNAELLRDSPCFCFHNLWPPIQSSNSWRTSPKGIAVSCHTLKHWTTDKVVSMCNSNYWEQMNTHQASRLFLCDNLMTCCKSCCIHILQKGY